MTKFLDFFCIIQEIAHKHNKYEAIPIILLGNKCDLQELRQVPAREGRKVGVSFTKTFHS